jgi:site-specific recombinase XerD
MLLGNYMKGFKRYALYEKEMNSNTVRDIVNTLKRLEFFTKVDSLKKLDTPTIRNYLYTQKEQRFWAARTFRNQRQYIKIFFNYCVSHGYVKRNPVDRIERPRCPKVLPRFLTIEQIHVILADIELFDWRFTLERYRNKAIIYTLLYTGIRLNELVHLQLSDINMYDKEIIIKKGKGRKERMIPIHARLFPILQNYLDYRKQQKQPSIWFFHSLRSTSKMTGRSVQHLCQRIGKRAGVKFTPHQLRHTFARNLVNAEIGLYKVKELMGHSSIVTTEIYLSVSKKALKDSFCEVNLM